MLACEGERRVVVDHRANRRLLRLPTGGDRFELRDVLDILHVQEGRHTGVGPDVVRVARARDREPSLLKRADERPVVDVERIGEHVSSRVAVEQDGVDVRTLPAAVGTRRREPGVEYLSLVEVRIACRRLPVATPITTVTRSKSRDPRLRTDVAPSIVQRAIPRRRMRATRTTTRTMANANAMPATPRRWIANSTRSSRFRLHRTQITAVATKPPSRAERSARAATTVRTAAPSSATSSGRVSGYGLIVASNQALSTMTAANSSGCHGADMRRPAIPRVRSGAGSAGVSCWFTPGDDWRAALGRRLVKLWLAARRFHGREARAGAGPRG